MRRIAGAGMGVLLATVAILYAVWPDLSAAKGKGDDAPIRVRNGSVRILSFDEDGSRPWKWVKKGSCKYQDGSQAACLSREPSKGESEIGSDTEHDASLYVRVNPGGYGACSTQGSTTASGELVEIWFQESKVKPEPAPFYFTFRRNTSGFTHYRVQISNQNQFQIPPNDATYVTHGSHDGYIEAVRVGAFHCNFPQYDDKVEIAICAKWQKGRCN